jgi:hypothetical protein
MKHLKLMEFDTWWKDVAEPRMNYFIDAHLEEYPDFTEDDVEDYTDFGCVHRMVHTGETGRILWDICEEVFDKGYNGIEWELNMSNNLFCNLDAIIEQSYEAGQRAAQNER